jgi:SAM-dependent methyltransferase
LTRAMSLLLVLCLMLAAAPAVLAQYDDDPANPEVPYVPTPQDVVDGMLKLANVTKNDVVYDLGCGDGRIVITAAQKFGARGVGVDINPERIREARENAAKAGVADKVKFIEKNLFEADIKEATVVTLYLLPGVNLRLKPKLDSDLKPGTRIVSHAFTMGEWEPVKEESVDGRRLYLWVMGKGKGASTAAAGR